MKAQMAQKQPIVDAARGRRSAKQNNTAHRPPTATEHRALASAEEGARFVVWFTRTAIDNECNEWVEVLPVSRVYEIADEARRRADHWNAFAAALERRVSRRARAMRSASRVSAVSVAVRST